MVIHPFPDHEYDALVPRDAHGRKKYIVVDEFTKEVLHVADSADEARQWFPLHETDYRDKGVLQTTVHVFLAANNKTHPPPQRAKAHPGRQRLPPHLRKRHRVNVLLTDDEYNKLYALGGEKWVYEQLEAYARTLVSPTT
jgi:hypothetical protein